MKLKHVSIITIALGISSCATVKTTVTDKNGTVTVTESTTLSGIDIATGAAGVAGAVKTVSSDK